MALSGTLTTNAVQEGRYYTLSWTASQSIDNNQSTISWTLSCAGGVAWYAERTLTVVIAGETVYSKSARVERYAGTIASGTKVISHDSAGAASFSASIQAAVYGSSINCTASGSFTLDTIPRKSTLAISNAGLGAKPTLTVTRKSSSFTHTITAKCGSNTVTICTKSSSTSITSWTIPISWATNNTTGTSVSVTYTITTYNGNTSIGSNTYTKTHSIPASVAPSISSVSVTDPEGYLASYGKYVSGLSKVAVSISASGAQGSTIKSYKTTIDGKTYTAASFTSAILSGSGTLTISVTVTDSRGRTATSSKTISVYAYAKPKISSMSVKRSDSSGVSDSSGAYVTVTFNASVTSLDSQNTSEYKVRYKKKSDTEYTEIVLTDYGDSYSVSGGTVTFAADTSSSYDVIMIAADSFNQDSVSGSAGTTSKVFSIFRRGLGIAFGKVAEIENAFEVAWDSHFRKTLNVDGVSSFSSNAFFGADVFDKYNMPIRNGLAMYTGSGDSAIDPDTTLYELVLTDKNTPSGGFMYIHTVFYSQKNATANCAQFAFPYSSNGSMYHRYRYENSWSEWRRHFNADEKRVYMICGNSVVTVTASTSVKIHTDTDVKNAFKNVHGIDVTTGKLGNVYAFVMNGDGNAQSAHLEGMTYLNSSYYVVSNTAFAAGNLRVRYCYLCWA